MSTPSSNRLSLVLQKIDEANRQDPNLEPVPDSGISQPRELLYSQRMSDELDRFAPDASEHLQIAARAQHIERWKSPRSNYPEGRSGYKQWRAELSLYHATRASEIMLTCGYPQEDCDRVKFLIQKRQMRRDPETQILEDVICLVFLKYYFADFANKHEESKLIDILQKTWGKMSDQGHKKALELTLPNSLSKIVEKALSEP